MAFPFQARHCRLCAGLQLSMILKNGNRPSEKIMLQERMNLDRDPIQSNWITV